MFFSISTQPPYSYCHYHPTEIVIELIFGLSVLAQYKWDGISYLIQ